RGGLRLGGNLISSSPLRFSSLPRRITSSPAEARRVRKLGQRTDNVNLAGKAPRNEEPPPSILATPQSSFLVKTGHRGIAMGTKRGTRFGLHRLVRNERPAVAGPSE